jgi:tetratricopeptide (TPR) repeat protein
MKRKKWYWSLCGVLALCLSIYLVVLPATISKADPADFEACKKAIATSNTSLRIYSCSRVLGDTSQPTEIRALAFSYRGEAYYSERDFDHAIADFTEALKILPQNASIYFQRGNAQSQKGEYNSAIADLTKSISLDGRSAVAYNERAWCFFKVGKADQGLIDAETSIKLDPNLAEALDTRGHIYEALGKSEKAIADYRSALAKNPNLQESKDALLRLGVAP